MSVTIALLPVVLAMRIVMGKDNFENWVKAQQVRVPSAFATELELFKTVKKAGFDAEKFGSVVKTHLNQEKSFFFWELVDGQWFAVFSKQHEQAVLDMFMSSVEAAAGRKIFGEIQDASEKVSVQYPTNFRDGNLLIEALTEFGAQPQRLTNGSISCKIEKTKLLFTQQGTSPYMVNIVKNEPSLEQVYRYMSDIDEDYKRCVQTAVYEKIKARAIERDMSVESEEVLPDKTILLTLTVS